MGEGVDETSADTRCNGQSLMDSTVPSMVGNTSGSLTEAIVIVYINKSSEMIRDGEEIYGILCKFGIKETQRRTNCVCLDLTHPLPSTPNQDVLRYEPGGSRSV